MFICNCNAIRERDVKQALDNPPEKTTPAQIYRHAAIIANSPSCTPQCGKCLCDFKDIAACHNADKGLDNIKKTIVVSAPADKIPA